MLRRIAERLSRRIVLKRRLPSRVGGDTIFVSPGSALSFWKWNLNKSCGGSSLFDWAEEFVKPGDVVWDIGSNVGLFTFASASRSGPGGHVVAIEPDVFLTDLVTRSSNLKSAPRAEISVIPAAVSDSVDALRLCVAERGRSTNHLESVSGSVSTGGTRETSWVITITLDWLVERFPAPKVMKIDTEGAEYAVLKGGQGLLSRHRPTILCEVNREQAEAVTELLRSHGYALYDLSNRSRGSINAAVHNTLACPRESEFTPPDAVSSEAVPLGSCHL